MPEFPTLTAPYPSKQLTSTFRGYDHNLKIGEGAFYHMENLTSDFYPLLANRGKRGRVKQLSAPHGLLGKSKLAYIDGTTLWYGDEDYSSYLEAKGFMISDAENMLPKQLVSMGAYIIIYPDKLYINTENPMEDCGSMEARFTTARPVTFTVCTRDGSDYGDIITGAAPPETLENGALWLDTSTEVHVLKQYSSPTAMWVDVPTVYTRMECAGIGVQFEAMDGVTIEGVRYTEEAAEEDTSEVQLPDIAAQLDALNGSHIIYAKGDDYIVIVGLLDQMYTQTAGTVTVSRTMPELDFITESENRLWGCKYGSVDGKTVNEIYCCVLGDFKNWNRFLGISTDSYVASVGTDGPWTGAVTHLGHPVFFKENCLHKVYISSTGAHQIVDIACRGVQKGSHDSLTVVNEQLYYKAVTDVMMYDGSLPVSISDAMGTRRYYDGVGGGLGDKYYLSLRDGDDGRHLFVYDTVKGLWHREDETQVMSFAACGGELYFIDGETGILWSVSGTEGEAEADVGWMAESGLMGYANVEQKYISRLNLRMQLPVGAEAEVFLQYDSDGIWHSAGKMSGRGTGTFMLPIRPRRCDHFKYKIQGKGDVRIFSLAKVYEGGSDTRYGNQN